MVVALAAVYVVTARLGLMLALPPEKKATAVWPPSGIALAGLLILGQRVWPGIWLGAFLANLWDYFNPANPFPLTAHLLVSAGIATGSTLQALAGSFLVRRWIGPGNPFDRASHAFTFAGVAMLMCLIAATCGVASLYYFTEFRVIWPDGSVHWLEARANVFTDAHDKPVRIIGVNMDVTERKLAEERLREFLATLAHELRNPLAPIRNALELLRRSDGNADLLEQARSMMGRQVEQMVRLIDDLLDMSRISQGKVQLRKERVELAVVVRSAVETVRPLIDAQAHELTITAPPEPIYLDADPTRLAQVISNLLNNAAKYTEKGGHVWLIAERQGNEAVISVRDTGIGIAAEHLPHLFEMFSQVAPALERSQGGLGIGLSLVRGLVELHGGSVEARTGGIGKGSEFIVRLPVVEAPVPHGEQRANLGEKPRSRLKHRILVVDDNRDAADSLAMMLSVSGHETRTAYDGLEAVRTAADFQPNVVLLDIGLPKLNGYEAARQIRKQAWGADMALIALTGWGQEEDKRRALEAGFDHHLTKPVEAAALEKLLARMTPVL